MEAYRTIPNAPRDHSQERESTMHVGIYHTINDAKKWEQTLQSVKSKVEAGTLPAGVKPVCFIPATSQKTTFCVWEAESIDSVREFIDRESGTAARNDYFEVDTKNAMGLPEVAAGKK
jgi:hypothetical protein